MLKSAGRIAVTIAGSIVLAIGIAMIVLPGPAIVFIPAGLAILATQFHWARRTLDWLKKHRPHWHHKHAGEQPDSNRAESAKTEAGITNADQQSSQPASKPEGDAIE